MFCGLFLFLLQLCTGSICLVNLTFSDRNSQFLYFGKQNLFVSSGSAAVDSIPIDDYCINIENFEVSQIISVVLPWKQEEGKSLWIDICLSNESMKLSSGKQKEGSQCLEKSNMYLLYSKVFCSHLCIIQVQKYLVGFHSCSHNLEETQHVRKTLPVNLSVCQCLNFSGKEHPTCF